MGSSALLLCYGWFWTVLLPVVSSTTSVLSSLADLDFHRLKANQFHSLEVPAISLQRELVGAGFHRELVTKVALEEASEFRNSRILLVENVTRDMYIDLDQIMSLEEIDFEMVSSGHMDTEKPASLSTDYVVLIYTHLHNISIELKIPVHFRYQPPSHNSTYTPVIIPAPLLLIPHPLGSASLPCHAHTRDTCLWELLDSEHGESSPPPHHHELKALIPCGLRNFAAHLVIGLTIVVTLVASAVILYAIAATTPSS